MKSPLETRRLILVLRSPVHVGTRAGQLTPLEAVPFSGRVHVLREDRLAAFLSQHRLLDEFVNSVVREGREFDLRSFLERKRLLSAESMGAMAAYSAATPWGLGQARRFSFRPLIRGGMGMPYIPGSSVKGAIRSAILNGRIAQMNETERAGLVSQAGRRNDPTARLLQGNLPLGPRNPGTITGPNRDFLRCLKVSDVEYRGDTAVYPVQVLSRLRGDDRFYLKELALWLECLPAGATLSCSLALDQGLLAQFRKQSRDLPFTDLDDVLAQVRAHAEKILDDERAFFGGLQGAEALGDFYATTDANLRVGMGSGLPAITVLLNLQKEQRFRLRDQVFRPHRDSQFFPKSRKVIMRGREPVLPLGWIRWDVAE